MARASPPVKSFWQFSVGQILTLTALISLIAAMIVYANREQMQIAAILRENTIAGERNMALGQAVSDQSSEQVAEILKLGADPNTRFQGTLVHEVAVRNGDGAVLRMLLEAGAIVVNSELKFVIDSKLSVKNKLKLMRILVENGAKITESVSSAAVMNPEPEIIDLLRLSGADYGPREMASLGRLEELRTAIKTDSSILNQRLPPIYAHLPGQEPTLLGIALRRGHEEMANWLIDIGADVSVLEERRNTLLFMAARGDCANIIERLCSLGCDPNAVDEYEDTPLMDCCPSSHPETILALIHAGAKVNVQNYSKSTPLHYALWRKQDVEEVVTLLLDAGADPLIVDNEGKSARDRASIKFPSLQNLYDRANDKNESSTR